MTATGRYCFLETGTNCAEIKITRDQGLRLVTPREHSHGGSHVCLAHAAAWPIMRALIARGLSGDFRAPDILRFGFAPLYVSYADVWQAVETLREILATRAWDHPEYMSRRTVT
ncbi:MAG: hypothetical protein ING59_00805 [Burkholderiales bacterium]|nr:hypothetical protein [Burkholderiales bacterium]